MDLGPPRRQHRSLMRRLLATCDNFVFFLVDSPLNSVVERGSYDARLENEINKILSIFLILKKGENVSSERRGTAVSFD